MKKDEASKLSINISRDNQELVGNVIIDINQSFTLKDYGVCIDTLINKIKRGLLEIAVENEIEKHSITLEDLNAKKRD